VKLRRRPKFERSAEGPSKTDKFADGEIHETSLTFSSTALTRKFQPRYTPITLEITAEDIDEVHSSALAPTGPLSSRSVRKARTHPLGNTVLYHLRTKFEPERLERVANTPCESDLDEFFEQVEVCEYLQDAALLR